MRTNWSAFSSLPLVMWLTACFKAGFGGGTFATGIPRPVRQGHEFVTGVIRCKTLHPTCRDVDGHVARSGGVDGR